MNWAKDNDTVTPLTDEQACGGFTKGCPLDKAALPVNSANMNAFGQWVCDKITTLIRAATCGASPVLASGVRTARDSFVVCIDGKNRVLTFDEMRSLVLPVCPPGLTTPMLTCNPATGVASWIEAPEAGGSTGGGTLTDAQIHAAVCRARIASDNESGRVMYCTTSGLAQAPAIISLGGGGA